MKESTDIVKNIVYCIYNIKKEVWIGEGLEIERQRGGK
jgi:hypothetical protein